MGDVRRAASAAEICAWASRDSGRNMQHVCRDGTRLTETSPHQRRRSLKKAMVLIKYPLANLKSREFAGISLAWAVQLTGWLAVSYGSAHS